MITNYFSDMVNNHNKDKKKVYELFSPINGYIFKEHADIGYLELLRQEKLSIGWSAEIRIKLH